MKTLTIEHLKGYLGTGLKIMENDDKIINEMLGVYNFEDIYTNRGDIPFTNFKPILYPLCDITKFREDLGFVPLHKLLENSNFNLSVMESDDILSYSNQFTDIDFLNYNDAMFLIKWHFDIHGLIEQGLAIDKTKL